MGQMEPVSNDPFEWFDAWYGETVATGLQDPNAMTLATAGKDGRASARVVLLKSHDDRGFVFYTNMESRKGLDMADVPWASLSFFWRAQGRQIRIEGPIEFVDDAQADAYFASRPRISQLGAWASKQSQPLASRSVLEGRVEELEAKYPEGTPIPRPSHWTGVRVIPHLMEFWDAGDFRLHDRFEFARDSADSPWSVDRLNP